MAVTAAVLSACKHDAIHTAKPDGSAPVAPDAAPEGFDDGGASDSTGGQTRDAGDALPALVATLVADKSVVSLGALEVASTGLGMFTVTNVGNIPSGPLVVTTTTGMTATGCNGALAPGGACSVAISVTPTVPGLFSGTVAIWASPGALIPISVSVIATVDDGTQLSVSPTRIALGDVFVGAATPKQVITITSGTAISDLTVAANGPDVSIDREETTCTAVLAANASCTVVLSFLAASAGARGDSIVVTAGASGKTIVVPITAFAQWPAKLVITPSSQSFAANVGQTSSPVTFGVANAGDVATGAIDVALTGPNAADFAAVSNCPSLGPLATCTVAVTYAPSAPSAVAATANLVVTDLGPAGSSVTALLSSWHGGLALTITPVAGDLGMVLVGAIGTATVFTVTNEQAVASGTLAIALSDSQFVVTNDTCTGNSLAAQARCTLAVALAPVSCGTKSATLTVTAANGAVAAKTLTGSGFTPQSLAVDRGAIDFGTVHINQSSIVETVTVKLGGCLGSTAPLSLTRSGDISAFPVTANTCSSALSVGAACTFDVAFAPTVPGAQRAAVTVTDGSLSATVVLAGTAVSM